MTLIMFFCVFFASKGNILEFLFERVRKKNGQMAKENN